MQVRGVDAALKFHLRAWAIAHGTRLIKWTCDPLLRPDAHLNLNRLGADLVAYHANFFGELSDAVNGRDESDRVLVGLDVQSAKPELDELNSTSFGADGGLKARAREILPTDLHGAPLTLKGPFVSEFLLCATPEDIIALRQRDPELPFAWRHAMCGPLGSAPDAAYRAVGLTPEGSYVRKRSV